MSIFGPKDLDSIVKAFVRVESDLNEFVASGAEKHRLNQSKREFYESQLDSLEVDDATIQEQIDRAKRITARVQEILE